MQVKSTPAARLETESSPRAAGRAVVGVAQHLRGSSLNRALDVLGDGWTQRILRESFLGVRHFDVFQRHLGIPRQTLSARLKGLVGHGILDARGEGYRLTLRGLALYPWALMIWRWTRRWSAGAGRRQPSVLTHLDCGRATRPVFACAACREEVQLGDVDYVERPPARRSPVVPKAPRSDRRWTPGHLVLGAPEAGRNVAFLTADRWTHLIIGAAFLGCRTFDVMQREVGISSNILAQRLALLVEAGFLAKTRSDADARRFEYALTPRSRDVFPLTITLVQWADEWLPARTAPPMTRIHRACGHPLHAVVACSACGEALIPQRVSHAPVADAAAP